MKCRVVQKALCVDLINAWGAKSVAMNFAKVHRGLQQSVIDAAPNEPCSYNIVKQYEGAFNKVSQPLMDKWAPKVGLDIIGQIQDIK